MNITKEKRQSIAKAEQILGAISNRPNQNNEQESRVDLVSLAKTLAARKEMNN